MVWSDRAVSRARPVVAILRSCSTSDVIGAQAFQGNAKAHAPAIIWRLSSLGGMVQDIDGWRAGAAGTNAAA